MVASVRRLVLAAILAAILAAMLAMMTAGPVQAQAEFFVNPVTGQCFQRVLLPSGEQVIFHERPPQACQATA